MNLIDILDDLFLSKNFLENDFIGVSACSFNKLDFDFNPDKLNDIENELWHQTEHAFSWKR